MKVHRIRSTLALGATLALVVAAPAPAAIVLQLDGIQGEATADGYAGQIELGSVQFGAGKQTAVKDKVGPSFSEFSLSKKLDRSSPELLRRLATGQTIPSGKITFYRTSAEASQEVVRYCLTGISVTGFSQSTGGDEISESVQLAYQTLRLTYDQQSASGGPGQSFSFGWDVVKNALLGQQACS